MLSVFVLAWLIVADVKTNYLHNLMKQEVTFYPWVIGVGIYSNDKISISFKLLQNASHCLELIAVFSNAENFCP